jgi:hypothetical protein
MTRIAASDGNHAPLIGELVVFSMGALEATDP